MSACAGAPQSGLSVDPSTYPAVRRDDLVEELHGVTIPDPYRWLEDPDAEETRQFVTEQNKVTEQLLKQCDSRDQFKGLLTKLTDYPKYGTPFKAGERYCYYHNTGLQQHYVLYIQDALDAPAKVLLDPNTLSKDGTVAISDTEFSEDGELLAYSTSSGGSDWVTIHVLKVAGGDGTAGPVELEDTLENVKFSCIAWTHDHKGFFYNRFPNSQEEGFDKGTETDLNTNQQLVYHVLGRPQSEDVVVFACPEHPTWHVGAEVTDDGKYLLVYPSEGCQPYNRLYYLDLSLIPTTGPGGALAFPAFGSPGSEALPLVRLVDDFKASYSYVANVEDEFYFRTNLDATRYRVVKIKFSSPGPPESWADVIPEHPKDLLQSARALKGDQLVLTYLRDVTSALQLHSLETGALKTELKLPGIGSVGGTSGTRKSSELFFSFYGFVEPGSTWRVDTADPQPEPALFRRTTLKVAHDPADYTTTQVFYPSKDGTRIPMFITHKRGLELDGTNPVLLYGYGGFNITIEPTFSASRLAWMKGYNAVFAVANIRGGGEYGIQWRDAGSKEHKQNVFDDFQAAAEYLIGERYCSPATLAIQGGSNGGTLVAACANQRPDLYSCVLAQVGVMDMLRFHKFTIGHAWTTDFGDPDEVEAFGYIGTYSPLHNVRLPPGGGQYPSMLLTTGDHDDRVVPLHSLKLAATLQHTLAGPKGTPQRNPLIIRVDVRAGHGAGKPMAMVIQEASDLAGFAAKCTGANWVGEDA